MAKMLVLNPVHRRRKRKAAGTHKRRRRRNPATLNPRHVFRHRTRRHRVHARRRRRNPVGGRLFSGIMPMIQQAFVGAAGAIVVDAVYHQINPMLPATLQTSATEINAGDAVKVLATIALGQGLRGVTRGWSHRLAQGALTVQFDKVLRKALPASITSQLGYMQPAMTVPGQPRLQPTALRAYTRPGVTPLLSRYTQSNVTPLLSAYSGDSVRERENRMMVGR